MTFDPEADAENYMEVGEFTDTYMKSQKVCARHVPRHLGCHRHCHRHLLSVFGIRHHCVPTHRCAQVKIIKPVTDKKASGPQVEPDGEDHDAAARLAASIIITYYVSIITGSVTITTIIITTCMMYYYYIPRCLVPRSVDARSQAHPCVKGGLA